MIVATLARNHGEIAAAARELQVSRTTMWRLMKKHGIDPELLMALPGLVSSVKHRTFHR